MIQMLSANLQALEKYAPDILARLRQIEGAAVEDAYGYQFSVCQARDGYQIDMLNYADKQVFLQSRYRPLEEAARFVEQYKDAKAASCFLFLGIGNGYIIRDLMQRLDVSYVFYEPSIAYFIYILSNYDISDILAAENVHFYVKGLNDKNILLEMYIYVTQWNWHSVFLEAMPKYQQLYPDDLQWLAKLREDSIFHAQQNYLNDIQRADVNMENAIYNLKYVFHGDSICQFENILPENVPVIVVAGGPSLEKNVDQLKQYRNRAFILAVDRVAKFLVQHGIQPHAYVTVDAVKPIELFESEGIDSVPWFLYTTSSYPAVEKLKKSRLIFCSTIYGYAEYLFQLCGSDLFKLANGGSVATAAVNVAMYMGSRNIILVGQDLAFSGDKTHAGERPIDLQTQIPGLMEVRGFYGDVVYADLSWKAYIDWYAAFVQHHPEITFINATEGGAYLEGMKHLSLAKAMEQYRDINIDGDRYFSNVSSLMGEEQQEILKKEYRSFLSYMKRLKWEVPSAVTNVEHGIHILEEYGFEHQELNKIERKMDSFQKLYEGHRGKSILNLGIAKPIQEALLDIQFTKENPTEEMTRLYMKMLAYFQGIEGAVKKSIPMLEKVLHDIEGE